MALQDRKEGNTVVLPAQDAEAKTSDSLKVTQIVIEQEPRFLFPSHLCFLGPNTEHLLESGQSSLALFYSKPPNAGVAFGGFTACANLSRTLLTLSLSGNRLFPLLCPASHVAWELD